MEFERNGFAEKNTSEGSNFRRDVAQVQGEVGLLVYERGLFLHLLNNIVKEKIEEQELNNEMRLRMKIQISAHNKSVTVRPSVHWLFIAHLDVL